MFRYALYARKSDEDTKLTEKSIGEQLDLWRTLGAQHGYIIAREFEESKSAKVPGVRPCYNEMMRLIEKGQINAILCWNINRLVRNMKEGGALAQLLVEGKLREIRTPSECYKPGDNILPLVVQAATSTQYSLDLAQAVLRGMDGHFQRGGLNYRARQGYRNERDPLNLERGIVVPDGDRFTLMRKAWDMLLTGAYTPVQVVTVLNDDWHYRTRKTAKGGGQPLTRSAAYKLFKDPFYAGYVRYKGQLRKGQHPPMVTEEEFQAVQTLLRTDTGEASQGAGLYRGTGATQRRCRQEFAFTGLMRCGECGQQITAERHCLRGKVYVSYHCANSYGRCTKKGLSEAQVEAEIVRLLTRLTLDEPLCQIALQNIARSLETKRGDAQAVSAQQERALDEIERQLTNLETMWLQGLMTDPARYQKREGELTAQKNKLAQEAQQSRRAWEQMRQNAQRATQYVCLARSHFLVAEAARKRAIAKALGTEYLFFGREKRLQIVPDPLLVEMARLARVSPTGKHGKPGRASGKTDLDVKPFEMAFTGSGSTKKAAAKAAFSPGGPEETLIEMEPGEIREPDEMPVLLSPALLHALRQSRFPALGL